MRILTTTLIAMFALAADRPAPSLTGRWHYSVPRLSGEGQTCSMENVSFVLRQSENDLSGRSSGGAVVCNGQTSPMTPAPIDSGATVFGDSVRFSIGPAMHRGRIHGDSIVGRIQMKAPQLSGTFIMKRAE